MLQKRCGHARCLFMSTLETEKTPRTYRLSTRLVQELRQFRSELRMRPSETSIVETAIKEFMEREREDKRAARR